MHGRPRQKPGQQDPERAKAATQKAQLFGQLAKEVLERRAARRYDAESLGLAAKLVELHPEVYTVWNYRREALQPVIAAGGEAAVAAVGGELALTERALMKNPKSYATWHHRRWAVVSGMCSLEHELKLVGLLLDADERNFHGWAYRRFVVQLMGTPAARELEYAEKKINQNFSNYSAWHARTALLPLLHGGAAVGDPAAAAASEALSAALHAASLDASQQQAAAGGAAEAAPAALAPVAGGAPAVGAAAARASSAAATSAVPKGALDAEYELVKQAFWTEPEDQSGWFYHRWLLGCSLAHWEEARGGPAEAAEREGLLGVLRREQRMCEELLEIEPDAKWPLLTLVRLQELQLQVAGGSAPAAAADAAGQAAGAAGEERAAGEVSGNLAQEVAEGYSRLIELDPLRQGYYRDALAGRAHVVARPAPAAV